MSIVNPIRYNNKCVCRLFGRTSVNIVRKNVGNTMTNIHTWLRSDFGRLL